MATLWPTYFSTCKSRLSAIARICFLGRERAWETIREQKETIVELTRRMRQSEARVERVEAENCRLREIVREAEVERARVVSPSAILPLGEAPPGQQYGVGMMTLCVNLARKIGLRPTVEALGVFF